jgi:crossover junction endodeoxyribonuclease RusA
VRLSFVMPRPVGTPKRRTPPAIRRPDVDKLSRAVGDALSGVCWRDDSQVVDLHATKRLAERDEIPGVLIQIGVAR